MATAGGGLGLGGDCWQDEFRREDERTRRLTTMSTRVRHVGVDELCLLEMRRRLQVVGGWPVFVVGDEEDGGDGEPRDGVGVWWISRAWVCWGASSLFATTTTRVKTTRMEIEDELDLALNPLDGFRSTLAQTFSSQSPPSIYGIHPETWPQIEIY